MKEIVKGVQVVRPGEGFAHTASPLVEMDLVAAGDNAEVIRFTFQAGAMFGFDPEPGCSTMECYTIIEGLLVAYTNQGERLELGPGTTLVAGPATEACVIEAVTSGSAMYVSSQPVFHVLDRDVSTLVNLAYEIESKDGYTREHCIRIQTMSRGAGLQLGVSQAQLAHLMYAALLHDVGKSKVPSWILGKPGPLTAEEWVIMRRHAEWGEEMAREVGLPEVATIVGQHHERIDGSGYPRGLKGDEILIESQILAVCDSWDAMTTDRVYRKALTQPHAAAELRRCAGRHYAPRVVEAFLTSIGYRET